MSDILVGGIEAGGTNYKCVLGTAGGRILDSASFSTSTPAETMRQALHFFTGAKARIQALGIAHFGPVDLDERSPCFGSVLKTPKQGWSDLDVVGFYRRALSVPVAFQSDVNAAAVGEAALGAGRGLRNFVYVTVGTGIGGGVMIDGRLLHAGRHPEIGHIYVGRDHRIDPFEGCCHFHQDCLEGLASGTALKARWGVSGEELGPDHPAWALQAHYLAAMCVNLVNCYVPEKIILGGGVMQQAFLPAMIRDRYFRLMNGYMGHVTAVPADDFIVASPMHGTSAASGALILAGLAMTDSNSHVLPN
jgi:fructokinase